MGNEDSGPVSPRPFDDRVVRPDRGGALAGAPASHAVVGGIGGVLVAVSDDGQFNGLSFHGSPTRPGATSWRPRHPSFMVDRFGNETFWAGLH